MSGAGRPEALIPQCAARGGPASAGPVARQWRLRPPVAMRRALGRLALVGALLAAGCAAPTAAPPEAPRTAAVHVVGHGWHTGIAIARADLPAGFPALADFALAEQLEFGWGDAEYYPARDPSVWLGIKALAWPTPSVLHVAAIRGDIAAAFPASTIVRVELTADGIDRLRAFIRDEFRRDPQGRVIEAGRGLYGDGRFYQARSRFHFPRTCNRWIAAALSAGGVPVEPATAVTAGALLSQVARHGQVVQQR